MNPEAPTVLLVDDQPDNLFVLKNVIKAHLPQCSIITASSALKGLEIAAGTSLDGILIDMQMPGMDGLNMCRRLKSNAATAPVPVLLITAHKASAELKGEGLEAGAYDFIVRPIDNFELVARIKAMLRIKEVEDKIRLLNAELEKRVAEQTVSLRHYQRAVESSDDWIIAVDARYMCLVANKACLKHHPDLSKEPGCCHISKILGTKTYETFKPHMDRCMKGEVVGFETEFVDPNLGQCYWQVMLSPLAASEGGGEGVVAIIRDIKERVQMQTLLRENESRLNYLVRYDSVTDLPNRILFQDRLQKAIAKAEDTDQKVALLFLDLDRFKNINNTLGREIGDTVLKEVAQRLKYWLRPTDTVAHLGGDKFLVLLEEVADQRYPATVARKFQGILSTAIYVESHELFVSASIGISTFPSDAMDMEGLLKCAEVAMYRAKDQGKGNYQFYQAEMDSDSRKHLQMESDLHKALALEQIGIFFQPQFDLQTGRLTGLEALARWHDPEKGIIPTDEFISLAEETGLILSIGEWILQTACAQGSAWQQKGYSPVRIAVNISGAQFKQEDFIERLELILDETGFDPNWLELEITESVVMENVEETIMTMTDLRMRGIHLSIDDFGTGYSSLSYLPRFPIDKLKIDRSFVKDVPDNHINVAIINSIIILAHSLDIEVIAEGVETEAQMEFLLERKCSQVQGFFFAPPLPVEEIKDLFEKQSSTDSSTRKFSVPHFPS